MNILVLDKELNSIDILSNSGENPTSPFFDDVYTQILSNGAETYEFSTVANSRTDESIQAGHYIIFRYNNKYKLFHIIRVEEEHEYDKVIKHCYCEINGLDMINQVVRATTIEGNIAKFFESILVDTGYKLGEVDPDTSSNIQTIIIKNPTELYTVIQDALEQYGFEIEYRVEMEGNVILAKYIDIYKSRGRVTNKIFSYTQNMNNVVRTTDYSEFKTHLIGSGSNGLDFKNIEWEKSKGKPCDKPLNSDFVYDKEAMDKFNYSKPIYGVFSYDTTDGNTLLEKTYEELQRIKEPKLSYEMDIKLLKDEYYEVILGDTVYVIDNAFNPPVLVSARISELKLSFTDHDNNELTLANFKEKTSGIKDTGIIENIMDLIVGVGKLSPSDIAMLEKYLADLDIQSEEIDKIIKQIIDSFDDAIQLEEDDIEVVGADKENYKAIKLTKTDGGLLLGDKRIYDIKKQGAANIVVDKVTEETTTVSSSKVSQQYKDALEYYENFSLGKNKDSSTLAKIMNESGEYKITYIVRYWCNKFGLDTRLVYAMIAAESSGNPYAATKTSAGGYGLMQCERGSYFNKKQTIKFLDGSTKSFTPSYSTMDPKQGKTITLNGVRINENISNQIMFGCNELRKNAEHFNFNIFATLMGYNMGPGGTYWCVCHYIKDKYGYELYGGDSYRGIKNQSTKVKDKYYDILDSHKAPFASYRQKYRNYFGESTVTNIEGYLRYYKPYKGSLPYFKDKDGNKIGYGAVVPSGGIEEQETTGKKVRDKIVSMAKTIVNDHIKRKKATYNQDPRTVRYDKPKTYKGTIRGIKNPVCYDCSSFVSCCYYAAGLDSVYNASCAAGTLVGGATEKSGYKMWKVDSKGIKNAKPGDIVMDANFKVTSSNLTKAKMTAWGATHHTMIYIGDGKVAHASQWAYHPEAIKITNISYYQNKGTAFFLRPWDLVIEDKKVSVSTGDPEEVVISDTVIKKETVSEVTLKGLPGATITDYLDLTDESEVDGIYDRVPFPKTVPYVFVHFGVNNLSEALVDKYERLLAALSAKYPKKPIFVAKELYVNSTYPNYKEVNVQIDAFNSIIENYCNKTQYVIFLDVSNGLVDSNGQILSSLSDDGYSFKDKSSVDKYYKAVKKAILDISVGQIIDSTATSVNLVAQSQKIHRYTKPISSLTLKLPSAVSDDFYSRLIFTTSTNSIKFSQSSILYMSGDHCKNGAFTPIKGTKYIVNIFMNLDDTISKKYYASVTADKTTKVVGQQGYVNTPGSRLNVRKGASAKYSILGKLTDNTKVKLLGKTSNGWYKINYKGKTGYISGKYVDNITNITVTSTDFTNYDNFKYRSTLVANAKTFYDNRSKFVYNNSCAFDYANPHENIDKWKTGGKYHLDDNLFTQMCLMGYKYDNIDLDNRTDRNKKSDVSWALPYISSESKLAKYFIENGWVLDDIDYTNYSNVEPGDILFYDVDSTNNNEFMAISHTAICVGKTDGVNYIIEGNNGSEAIRIIPITDRSAVNLCFIGRINKN